jgi:hypothetical protein
MMENRDKLSDFDHPEIKKTVQGLITGMKSSREKVESIFNFVRDEIQYGFPPVLDAVKASETLKYKIGNCTTKATLFHALCQAAEIPSRIHVGWIKLEIMRGIFPSFAYKFLPEAGTHSWMEVELDGQWRPIDSYINDKILYEKALKKLQDSNWLNGFSISLENGPSSCEFNFGEEGFVHMGAVVEDHGTWEDVVDYMSSEKHVPMDAIQSMTYSLVLRPIANKNLRQISNG